MNLGAVKRAPKWAWYTVGGVVIGGGALKLWKNRTTSTGGTPASGAADPTTVGSAATTSGPGAIISPPVIVDTGTADQSGTGLGALQDLYMSGASGIIDAFSSTWAQMQGTQDTLLRGDNEALTTLATMNAGTPPAPVIQNPTPVVNITYTPPAATGKPAPAPTRPPASNTCPAGFPHRSARGCYREECDNGKGKRAKGMWHVYSNGTSEHVRSTC